MESATAIVLRVVPWSESSLVVTLFSREAGKVRAVAKGARRPKSAFDASLDVLALVKVVFIRKTSDALDILTESRLLRRFRLAGHHLAPLYAAYYVIELLGELTDDYDPQPGLFDDAVATLSRLAGATRGNEQVAPILISFELAAFRHLGYPPTLDSCSECGREVAPRGRVAFSPATGGVLCPLCRPGKRQVISLSENARLHMARLSHQDPSTLESANTVPLETANELRRTLNQYTIHILGRKPRLHDYLR